MGIPPFSSPPPIKTVLDTRANILELEPSGARVAFSIDTNELFIWDGSSWNVASIKLSETSGSPDLGWSQESDKQGYGDDCIQGKRAYDFSIGDFTDTPYAGAIKVDHSTNPPTFEIYIRNRWYSLVYDLNMDNGGLQHIPEEYTIRVRSGDSVDTGLNGQPTVQEYQVDLGAYPYPTIIDGGEF